MTIFFKALAATTPTPGNGNFMNGCGSGNFSNWESNFQVVNSIVSEWKGSFLMRSSVDGKWIVITGGSRISKNM